MGNGAHIAPEGVHITTTSINPATIHVSIASRGGEPRASIIDEAGTVVAQGTGAELDFEIPNAALWSAESPALYRCRVDLLGEAPEQPKPESAGGMLLGIVSEKPAQAVLDRAEVTFGIRMLEWSADGLFVNGRETLLRGGCIHCDNGVLGAASWPESEQRRIRLL